MNRCVFRSISLHVRMASRKIHAGSHVSNKTTAGVASIFDKLRETTVGVPRNSEQQSPDESFKETSKQTTASCGENKQDDDEMEQEEMFVDAYEGFEFKGREWGGPRRGGRYPEPTRYGDWERKGRCTDF